MIFPVISIAVKPKDKGGSEKWESQLERWLQKIPHFV